MFDAARTVHAERDSDVSNALRTKLSMSVCAGRKPELAQNRGGPNER